MGISRAAIAGLALLVSIYGPPLQAEEPAQGVIHKLTASNYSWQIDGGNDPVLTVFAGNPDQPRGRFDLSGCLFCAGEGDNCESDGVAQVSLPANPGEPILAVTCHVGAHSQSVDIFAPWRNQSEPVFSVTGAYNALSRPAANGVTLEYDRSNDDGTFSQIVEHWPPASP